jgi:hypothetical protein
VIHFASKHFRIIAYFLPLLLHILFLIFNELPSFKKFTLRRFTLCTMHTFCVSGFLIEQILLLLLEVGFVGVGTFWGGKIRGNVIGGIRMVIRSVTPLLMEYE